MIDLTLKEAQLLSLLCSYLHEQGNFDEIIEGHEDTLRSAAKKMVAAYPNAKWSSEYGTFGEIANRDQEERLEREDERLKRRLSLLNWCLSRVTELPREADQVLTLEDQKVLEARSYTNPKTGAIVNFGLPEEVADYPKVPGAPGS